MGSCRVRSEHWGGSYQRFHLHLCHHHKHLHNHHHLNYLEDHLGCLERWGHIGSYQEGHLKGWYLRFRHRHRRYPLCYLYHPHLHQNRIDRHPHLGLSFSGFGWGHIGSYQEGHLKGWYLRFRHRHRRYPLCYLYHPHLHQNRIDRHPHLGLSFSGFGWGHIGSYRFHLALHHCRHLDHRHLHRHLPYLNLPALDSDRSGSCQCHQRYHQRLYLQVYLSQMFHTH